MKNEIIELGLSDDNKVIKYPVIKSVVLIAKEIEKPSNYDRIEAIEKANSLMMKARVKALGVNSLGHRILCRAMDHLEAELKDMLYGPDPAGGR